MIKLIKSTFYNEKETKKALAQFILETEILSMGQQCQEFEKAFARKQNRKYAVFVSNGSAANLILIQAFLNLGWLKKGDPVAVSSVTWATNVMPLMQLGLEPVVLDCELSNLNVSREILEKAYTENLKGLFLTNVLGFAADINELRDFCKDKNMLFFEDNCESLGSKVGGELLGNFGVASTFSTFVGHHLSTIEGGFVCTDDEELYEMLLMIRAHGWDRNLSSKKQKQLREKHGINDFYARYTFYELAYNTRPTEINGFIGNLQIQYWDEIVEKRHAHFQAFNEATKSNDSIVPLELEHMDLVSNFAMPVVFKTPELKQEYQTKFIENQVEIRPIIAGNIANQPFFKKHTTQNPNCDNADFIHKNGFYFGNNPEMTKNEVEQLCSLLKK
ncbi:DegT/DnrJ/EryC1/StrS aminotransferase family protein [Candidatus Peregrinibacteria bacterium]|jgi:CDP-4-dehydro-6-deoxyglucose reductase, E1|nr:DegT/DnrJ/EryC1/StrS aminotransferase family protein [Candidatus Peregrinibacteria bacterium]